MSDRVLKLVVAMSLFGSVYTARSATETFELKVGITGIEKPPTLIKVQVVGKKDGESTGEVPAIDVDRSPGAHDPQCYELLRKPINGGDSKTLGVTIASAYPILIALKPSEDLDIKKYSYALRIKVGSLKLRQEYKVANSYEGVELALDEKWIKLAQRYYQNSMPERSIKLQQGTKTGTFSAKAAYKTYLREFMSDGVTYDDPSGQHHFHLDSDSMFMIRGSADISFDPAEKGQYLNNLEGETGLFLSGEVERSLVEFGVSTKTQADQQFKIIDQTASISLWCWLNNRFTASLARSLFISGEDKRPPSQDHPLFIFGYDYVGHVKADASRDTKLDGKNRLNGELSWPIPIARDFAVPVPLIQKVVDVDLIVGVKGVYDFENNTFAPEINSSLDFALAKVEKHPSITFSYVNGKAAPKFQNFNAFLAGFKMPF